MTAISLPELTPYQDQPRQAPAGRVAKTGIARLRFAQRGTKTILADMYRKTPLLVQQALYWDEALPGMACVYLISTSGCVLQGDRLHLSVDMAAGTQAHLTTQSATKVHSMDANYASMEQRFELSERSYLEYMPGVTIPHRNSRYVTQTDIVIDPTATMLMSEIVMPGRKHHAGGEAFCYDLFSALVRVTRPDGARLFTEKILIEPAVMPVRSVGVMGKYDVFANVIALTPSECAREILAQTEPGVVDGVYSGASVLPNDAGLIFKVIGSESGPVKRSVRHFWSTVRATVLGAALHPEPRWG